VRKGSGFRVQGFRGSKVQRFKGSGFKGSGGWAQRVVEFVLFVSFVELIGLNRTN
jgi:hypothetical protein